MCDFFGGEFFNSVPIDIVCAVSLLAVPFNMAKTLPPLPLSLNQGRFYYCYRFLHVCPQERGDHLFLGPSPEQIMNLDVLHEVEGLCLVMMCSCRVMTRKLAIHLLKEVRNIFSSYSVTQVSGGR